MSSDYGTPSLVPDLQFGWLLLQSAGPRANHMFRQLPLGLSSDYASPHDDGMWRTAVALLGAKGFFFLKGGGFEVGGAE